MMFILGLPRIFWQLPGAKRTPYHYELDDAPDGSEGEMQEITSDICLADIGTCFSLADIQSCQLKNGWMGSVKCFLTNSGYEFFRAICEEKGRVSWDK